MKYLPSNYCLQFNIRFIRDHESFDNESDPSIAEVAECKNGCSLDLGALMEELQVDMFTPEDAARLAEIEVKASQNAYENAGAEGLSPEEQGERSFLLGKKNESLNGSLAEHQEFWQIYNTDYGQRTPEQSSRISELYEKLWPESHARNEAVKKHDENIDSVIESDLKLFDTSDFPYEDPSIEALRSAISRNPRYYQESDEEYKHRLSSILGENYGGYGKSGGRGAGYGERD